MDKMDICETVKMSFANIIVSSHHQIKEFKR